MAARATSEFQRIVSRPWFVVSLVTLLLNDWVLKPTYGNALTGKLSDFAGLGLVAFVLGHLSTSQLRRWPSWFLGIGLVAFVATKLDSDAAGSVSTALDLVLPWSNSIAPDPSDVVSLSIVPIAWWRSRLAQRQLLTTDPSLRWPLGALALLACTASSYTDTEHWLHVNESGEVDVYRADDGSQRFHGPVPFEAASVSSDGAWTGRNVVLGQVEIEELQQGEAICRRSNPSHCVRATNGLSIAETLDGGDTWSMIWAIDGDSKYASQAWVDSQLHYVDREVGIRQLVIADDGTVVAILAPDLFVSRSPAGDWSLGESWFRQIPRGVIVQLLGGFVILSLIGAISLRLLPTLHWPLPSIMLVVAILLALGQIRILGPIAIALLGCFALVLVAASLLVDLEGRHSRPQVLLQSVLIPVVPAVIGVVLIKTWQDDGGSLDTRRLFHIAIVLCVWALGVIIRRQDRLESTSASEPVTT